MKSYFSKTAANKRKRDKERQIDPRLEKELTREAKWYARRIREAAANVELDYIMRGSDPDLIDRVVFNKHKQKKISFTDIVCSVDEILFRVDARPEALPRGLRIIDLEDPENVRTMAYSVGRNLHVRGNALAGLWYSLERDGSVGGIPSRVVLSPQLIAEIPKSEGPTAYIAGRGVRGRLVVDSWNRETNLLVAGSVGKGKSIWLNQLICTLIWRAKPSEVQMILCDMKGGADLQPYSGIPHLYEGREIIERPAEMIPLFHDLKTIIEQRNAKLKAAGKKSIKEWNYTHKDDKWPIILVIVDEIGQLLANPNHDLKQEGEDLLGNLLQISRSSGVFFVLCTQDIRGRIVTGFIKTNCDTRICFSVPNKPVSIMVIGDGQAARLSPKGRLAYLGDRDTEILQGPYIGLKSIRKIVKQVKARYGTSEEMEGEAGITHEDIVRYGLEQLDGSLAVKPLMDYFGNLGISEIRLRGMLKELDDRTIVIDGKPYHIPAPERRKRREVAAIQNTMSRERNQLLKAK